MTYLLQARVPENKEDRRAAERADKVRASLLTGTPVSFRLQSAALSESHFAANHSAKANASQPTVCVYPNDMYATLQKTVSAVLEGLPPWPAEDRIPEVEARVTVAVLTQVSQQQRLSMLPRVFHHLYDPYDTYLYLVDEGMLSLDEVKDVLPKPLPKNVAVVGCPHTGYYHWPRVQVLLNGLKVLLNYKWDFVIHASESDYPLHSMRWIRATLSLQRRHIFLRIHPRCKLLNRHILRSNWFWWTQDTAVASCEGAFIPHTVQGVRYPMEELEEQGFIFASASEWMILPRELVRYAMLPELNDFKRFIGMHDAADEIFWATLVLNIPGLTRTINPQTWFMYRSPTNWGHSPDTLLQKHLDMILAERRMSFFLRKVDPGHSLALLDTLDHLINEPDDPPGAAIQSWPSRQHAISCAWRQLDAAGPSAFWLPPRDYKITAPFPAPAPAAASWLERIQPDLPPPPPKVQGPLLSTPTPAPPLRGFLR